MDNFFDLLNEVNSQTIDQVVINTDDEDLVDNVYKKKNVNEVLSGPVSVRGYDNTERGKGAGRKPRGNHREGQIVDNNNVNNRKIIRNQITQILNSQNPIINIRNNQPPRRIVFDSDYFEISNRAPRRVNLRFKESNINYEVSFKNLPNNHLLQDILYGCIDKLINLSFTKSPNLSRGFGDTYWFSLYVQKRYNNRNDNGKIFIGFTI